MEDQSVATTTITESKSTAGISMPDGVEPMYIIGQNGEVEKVQEEEEGIPQAFKDFMDELAAEKNPLNQPREDVEASIDSNLPDLYSNKKHLNISQHLDFSKGLEQATENKSAREFAESLLQDIPSADTEILDNKNIELSQKKRRISRFFGGIKNTTTTAGKALLKSAFAPATNFLKNKADAFEKYAIENNLGQYKREEMEKTWLGRFQLASGLMTDNSFEWNELTEDGDLTPEAKEALAKFGLGQGFGSGLKNAFKKIATSPREIASVIGSGSSMALTIGSYVAATLVGGGAFLGSAQAIEVGARMATLRLMNIGNRLMLSTASSINNVLKGNSTIKEELMYGLVSAPMGFLSGYIGSFGGELLGKSVEKGGSRFVGSMGARFLTGQIYFGLARQFLLARGLSTEKFSTAMQSIAGLYSAGATASIIYDQTFNKTISESKISGRNAIDEVDTQNGSNTKLGASRADEFANQNGSSKQARGFNQNETGKIPGQGSMQSDDLVQESSQNQADDIVKQTTDSTPKNDLSNRREGRGQETPPPAPVVEQPVVQPVTIETRKWINFSQNDFDNAKSEWIDRYLTYDNLENTGIASPTDIFEDGGAQRYYLLKNLAELSTVEDENRQIELANLLGKTPEEMNQEDFANLATAIMAHEGTTGQEFNPTIDNLSDIKSYFNDSRFFHNDGSSVYNVTEFIDVENRNFTTNRSVNTYDPAPVPDGPQGFNPAVTVEDLQGNEGNVDLPPVLGQIEDIYSALGFEDPAEFFQQMENRYPGFVTEYADYLSNLDSQVEIREFTQAMVEAYGLNNINELTHNQIILAFDVAKEAEFFEGRVFVDTLDSEKIVNSDWYKSLDSEYLKNNINDISLKIADGEVSFKEALQMSENVESNVQDFIEELGDDDLEDVINSLPPEALLALIIAGGAGLGYILYTNFTDRGRVRSQGRRLNRILRNGNLPDGAQNPEFVALTTALVQGPLNRQQAMILDNLERRYGNARPLIYRSNQRLRGGIQHQNNLQDLQNDFNNLATNVPQNILDELNDLQNIYNVNGRLNNQELLRMQTLQNSYNLLLQQEQIGNTQARVSAINTNPNWQDYITQNPQNAIDIQRIANLLNNGQALNFNDQTLLDDIENDLQQFAGQNNTNNQNQQTAAQQRMQHIAQINGIRARVDWEEFAQNNPNDAQVIQEGFDRLSQDQNITPQQEAILQGLTNRIQQFRQNIQNSRLIMVNGLQNLPAFLNHISTNNDDAIEYARIRAKIMTNQTLDEADENSIREIGVRINQLDNQQQLSQQEQQRQDRIQQQRVSVEQASGGQFRNKFFELNPQYQDQLEVLRGIINNGDNSTELNTNQLQLLNDIQTEYSTYEQAQIQVRNNARQHDDTVLQRIENSARIGQYLNTNPNSSALINKLRVKIDNQISLTEVEEDALHNLEAELNKFDQEQSNAEQRRINNRTTLVQRANLYDNQNLFASTNEYQEFSQLLDVLRGGNDLDQDSRNRFDELVNGARAREKELNNDNAIRQRRTELLSGGGIRINSSTVNVRYPNLVTHFAPKEIAARGKAAYEAYINTLGDMYEQAGVNTNYSVALRDGIVESKAQYDQIRAQQRRAASNQIIVNYPDFMSNEDIEDLLQNNRFN